MTRKSGRTGSTSTVSSSSPRDSTAINHHHHSSTTTTPNSPANKLNKRPNSGGLLLNGGADSHLSPTSTAGDKQQQRVTMTKAPRVNGVTERTSPIKTHHHHHHNGSAENLLLENGFHNASTNSTGSPKASCSGIQRSKRDSSGTGAADEKEVMGSSPRLVVLNGGDQSMTITGNSSNQKVGASYLTPTKSPVNSNSSSTPLYKVIDKSMSYTKSPQLLSPGGGGGTRLQSQSPTTGVITPSPTCITKSPAEEVKSHRRGQQAPSPVVSPLKSIVTPIKSSSRPNTPAGVGRGGKKRGTRKNELSLLNHEAENFMFPKAKEDVDSDSSDVIIIVKGKKKTKTKGDLAGAAAASNVDDQTMALIKSEMGEDPLAINDEEMEGDDEDEEVAEEEPAAKAVNLLPLKKRFGASKVKEETVKPAQKKKQKAVAAATPKRGSKAKVVPVKIEVEEEEELIVEEEELSVAKGKKKHPQPPNQKGKRGAAATAAVLVKEELIEEEDEMPIELPPPVKPNPKNKRVKKETAKERRKREKLEKELSKLIKTEPEDNEEEEEPIVDEETYSNLTRLMEAEEVQQFRFAFERVPSMEPWFAAFNRQDEGEERIFEYYGSTKYHKLPYEMGELPPLPQNCCALSHLRGTPTKSPRKGRPPVTPGEFSAKPTRLFSSARISQKRNKMLPDGASTKPPQQSAAKTRRSLPVTATATAAQQQQIPAMPRKRGRPPLAARRLQDESTAAREGSVDSDGMVASELSAKQRAAVTKNIVDRKRKLLAELEHPRKSPREHASTLAILSCLLQQRQLNSEKGKGDKDEDESAGGDQVANGSEEDMSSETASERRDSVCLEADDVKDQQPEKSNKTTAADETPCADEEEVEDGGSDVMAVTTTDCDTETENGPKISRKRSRSQVQETVIEEMLLPMTPPPVPVNRSRTQTPANLTLKRSNSSMSNHSAKSVGGKKKKKKHAWRARDSINAQELNREIESLLMDPLNASAESIDSKLLDKSDEFLMPFHELPDFGELVLSVDAEDYKQGYVRKSFAPKRSLKAAAAQNNILQLDYQLRSTKKRKNRTGWPTNKRRTSAAATQAKIAKDSKRSVSCDVKGQDLLLLPEEDEEAVQSPAVEGDEEDEGETEEQQQQVKDDKRTTLTIITEPNLEADHLLAVKDEDPLQRSPILRKLLSPHWRSKDLMPSPGRGGRGTSSSPNGLLRRAKSVRSPVSDLLMDGDESQSVSSISVMVSDDPDGHPFSSDNNTRPATQSPGIVGGMRLFKQTTLSRFFGRKKASATVTTASVVTTTGTFAAVEDEEAEQEKEKENIETDENSQQEDVEEEEEDDATSQIEIEECVDDDEEMLDAETGDIEETPEDEIVEEEEEQMEIEDAEELELEQEPVPKKRAKKGSAVVAVDNSSSHGRRKSESKLKNGINMNPIISIKKLTTELTKIVTSSVGGGGGRVAPAVAPVKAKARRVNRSSGNASIRSKRQRRRKIA